MIFDVLLATFLSAIACAGLFGLADATMKRNTDAAWLATAELSLMALEGQVETIQAEGAVIPEDAPLCVIGGVAGGHAELQSWCQTVQSTLSLPGSRPEACIQRDQDRLTARLGSAGNPCTTDQFLSGVWRWTR